jgi:hypothetical protein
LFIAACLRRTAYPVHPGNLDAPALAERLPYLSQP